MEPDDELPGGRLQLHRDHGYYFQCQMQIFVTRRLFGDFVLWTPREVHIERITLDEELIQTAISTEKSSGGCVYFLNSWGNGTHASNATMFSAHLSTRKPRKKTVEDGVTVERTRVGK